MKLYYGYNIKYDKLKDECVPADSNYLGFYYVGSGDMGNGVDTLYIFMSDSLLFNSYRIQAKEMGFDNTYPEYGSNHYIYSFPEGVVPKNWYVGLCNGLRLYKKIKYGFAIVGNV